MRVLCSYIPEIGKGILDLMCSAHSDFFGGNILTSLSYEDDLTPIMDSREIAHRPYLDGLVTLQRHKKPVVLSYDEIPDGKFVLAHNIINRRLNPSLFCDSVSILDDVDGKSGHHFHKFTRNLCKDQQPNGRWEFNLNDYKALVSGWGYLHHKFHADAGKCVIAIDKHLVQDVRNGRTGKSILMSYACQESMPTTKEIGGDSITGRTNFIFNGVKRNTQYIVVDETNEKFPWSQFVGVITSTITIDNKYGEDFTIERGLSRRWV